MKKRKGLSRLLCAVTLCLLVLCLLPATANAACPDHTNLTVDDCKWEYVSELLTGKYEVKCLCKVCDQRLGTLTLKCPDMTYTGQPYNQAQIAYSSDLIPRIDMSQIYYRNTRTGSIEEPIKAQSAAYRAYLPITSRFTAEYSFYIKTANFSYTTAPAAADLTYTGQPQTLLSTAGASDQGTLLYQVGSGSYGVDIPTGTGVGTYKVRIKIRDTYGDDNYAYKEIKVKIKQADIADAVVTLDKTEAMYTGSAHTPSVTSVVWNGTTLVEGTDYTVSYPADMTNSGAKTVQVKGKGNFTGTATAAYTITPMEAPDITFPAAVNAITYDADRIGDAGLTFESNDYGTFTWENPDAYPVRAGDDYTSMVLFTPTDPVNYDWKGKYGADWIQLINAVSKIVNLPVNKGNPKLNVAEGQTAVYDGAAVTYGKENADILYTYLGTSAVTATWYADNDGQQGEALLEAPVEAGTYWLTVTAEADANYTDAAYTQKFVIQKADPQADTAPAALALTYNAEAQALISEGRYAAGKIEYAVGTSQTEAPADGWQKALPKGQNAGIYYVWYRLTPDDTHNYNTVTCLILNVSIGKAAAPTIEFPTVLNSITYGQPLSEAKLSTYEHPLGTFNWLDPQKVLNAGIQEAVIGFYPSELALQNYNWSENPVRKSASVTVNKADPTYTAPAELVAAPGQTLADVALPNGWSWADTSLDVGAAGAQTHNAVFTPQDTDNYNVLTVPLTLVVCPDVTSIEDVTEETVTAEQKQDLEALLADVNAALAAEDQLPEEKAEALKEAKAKLDALIAGLPPYEIISGNGSQWTVGSGADLTFVANGHFTCFTGIKVDGKAVDPANYTAASGSTKVILKASYLNTLSRGKHTITVCYGDGVAEGSFKIVKTGGAPDTFDPAQPVLLITMMTLSAAALYLTLRKMRKI